MDRPLRRIALVCDWYAPRRGGIEAHLDGLATRLAARGHDVHVVTSTRGPSEVNGIRIHRLAVPLLPFAGVAAAPLTAAVAEVLKRERIELVHSHVSIVAPVALAGALAAERAALPSVVTFHSFIPATPVVARAAGWLLGASRWPAVMTAVSGRVAREVQSFAPGNRFSILPNAVDTAFWTPAAEAPSAGAVHYVYAGRLQAKKRPLLLLRVLRALTQTNSPWKLTIAGEGPLGPRLERGVRELGVADRVSFAGWTDAVRLREILRASDVFLSTAVRESFGLAALEARAVGVPVVAVRDSAVADFIADEQSGLLADDDTGFAAAAVRLLADPALRARIARHNREQAVGLGWDRALALHERAYDEGAALRR